MGTTTRMAVPRSNEHEMSKGFGVRVAQRRDQPAGAEDESILRANAVGRRVDETGDSDNAALVRGSPDERAAGFQFSPVTRVCFDRGSRSGKDPDLPSAVLGHGDDRR